MDSKIETVLGSFMAKITKELSEKQNEENFKK